MTKYSDICGSPWSPQALRDLVVFYASVLFDPRGPFLAPKLVMVSGATWVAGACVPEALYAGLETLAVLVSGACLVRPWLMQSQLMYASVKGVIEEGPETLAGTGSTALMSWAWFTDAWYVWYALPFRVAPMIPGPSGTPVHLALIVPLLWALLTWHPVNHLWLRIRYKGSYELYRAHRCGDAQHDLVGRSSYIAIAAFYTGRAVLSAVYRARAGPLHVAHFLRHMLFCGALFGHMAYGDLIDWVFPP